MNRLLEGVLPAAWAYAVSLYRRAGALAGRAWAFANNSQAKDRKFAELVNFDKLSVGEPNLAVGQISNAISNLRSDCAQYSHMLVLNFLISASIAVGVSLVSDRDLLLNNKVPFPVMDLEFPIFLIISFAPLLQIFVFISLCRSARAIDRLALAIRTRACQLASVDADRIDLGIAMPAVLLPPSGQLLPPVDRIISMAALGISIASSMALTVRLLSAFGWTSQHLLLAVLWGVFCISSLWLPLSRRGLGGKMKGAVAAALFSFGMIYLYLNTHTHKEVGLDLDSDTYSEAHLLEPRSGVFKGEHFINSDFDVTAGSSIFPDCMFDKEVLPSETPLLMYKKNLHKSNFEGALLGGLQFDGMNLSQANFRNAIIHDVDFDGVIFRRANFEGACLINVNFKDSDLSGANFTNVRMAGGGFDRTNLSAATFGKAAFHEVKIDNALFGDNTDFQSTIWYRSHWNNPTTKYCPDRRREKGSVVANASFDGILLFASTIRADSLCATSWRNSHVVLTDFIDVNLAETSFSDSSFIDSQIKRGTVKDADFCLIFFDNFLFSPESGPDAVQRKRSATVKRESELRMIRSSLRLQFPGLAASAQRDNEAWFEQQRREAGRTGRKGDPRSRTHVRSFAGDFVPLACGVEEAIAPM